VGIVNIIIAIVVLGILVFVHELGHFLMARLSGIGVETFSVGFGKELWGFTRGETRYRISVVPFGGYCRMKGEVVNDDEEREKDPHAMNNRPAWARVLTVAGGALFNVIFAILILAVLYGVGYKDQKLVPKVEVLASYDDGHPTPAAVAGLKTGDVILSIDGKKIDGFSDITRLTALSAGKKFTVVFLRSELTQQTTLVPVYRKSLGMGDIGVIPVYQNLVGGLKEDGPASKVGILAGDRITAIDGIKVSTLPKIKQVLSNRANQEVTVTVDRKGKSKEFRFKLGRFQGRGYLGVSFSGVETYAKRVRAKNPVDAFEMSFAENWRFLGETIKGLGAMFKGKVDAQRNVGGPIRMVQLTGEVAQYGGLVSMIRFMAMISMALGFFNMLPIPGFDGGHFVINSFEMITRIKPNEKIRRSIEMAGVLFILGLFVLVTMNDLFNIFTGR